MTAAIPRGPGRPAGGSAKVTVSWHGRRLLLRLHFYAGVLVAPFLLIAALTGLAYTITPQLDRLVYADELYVDHVGTAPRPLAEQIAAARAAHPEGTLAAVLTGDGARRTTRVVLDVPELGDRQRTVYVDPYTGQVRGTLTTWWGSTPLTTWLDDLHRNLHLGPVGRNYSEVAASWLWVVATGGLVLWVARRRRTRRARRILLPDLAARGRRRTMAWHGSTGVWLLVGLLFLSATGLTWSRYAGAHFTAVLDATHSHAPDLDTALPAAASTGSAPAGHHHARTGGTGGVSGADRVDRVLAAARTAGVDGPVEIGLPGEPGTAWTVTQTDKRWPVRLDAAAIDPTTAVVTAKTRWADYPLPAKLSKLGVAAHMGQLFGPANQILLAALALGLICVIIWGFRMWWQRRPTRDDRPGRRGPLGPPPSRGAWHGLSKSALIVGIVLTAAVGWALPVLGVTMLVFLAVDLLVGAVGRRAARRPV
ncbi:PepSY domain-containing protein [Frankia sp. QA3]|uniref:PepSY-associated TM helix domain-containing protein n=1 Tax=Frankia sp. QA3 TaxID=710111 RepID=UPI000269C9B1|nr:PepSY domain-containing protein [Frankia sp. QA3]EIV94674.1 putative iron-regulated membrane protein [Frankia sp. QA3]